jgi:hypothetical protein
MKLLHKKDVIGEITDVGQDDFWMLGRVQLNSEGQSLRQFFDYMTDEGNSLREDPPFGADLLNPETWHIIEKDDMRGIEVPAVYPDGLIYWRWR